MCYAKARPVAIVIHVQNVPDLDYREYFSAGPGWLRLHFDSRLPFSMILGWLRLPFKTTDYTCTISTNSALRASSLCKCLSYCFSSVKSLKQIRDTNKHISCTSYDEIDGTDSQSPSRTIDSVSGVILSKF